MKMQLEKEDQLLDISVRRKIIQEIKACENQERKDEHFKRYECYKDLTSRYVIEELLKQFNQTTVEEMSYALCNLSVVRKVIDKLARVYSNGVTRTVPNDPQSTEQIEQLAKKLDFNSTMKKINRFFKLHKNTKAYIKPYKCYEGEVLKYGLKVEALPPFLYDVVENYNEREKDLCVILSHYKKKDGPRVSLDPAREGRSLQTPQLINRGNDKDEIIADDPSDTGANKNEYIWWSNTYHFTTNELGEILSEGDGLNPIGQMPFVNFALDQDGSFWAIGGNDLTDMGILINSLVTHMNHISITQGYGQFFMKGKNLPRSIQIGPNKAILMEYQEGEPIPDLGYVSANPPLNDIKTIVEQQIALLLTTNNLSTSGISASLSGAQNAASGIALILDKAESMEDVQDQQQIFHDKEPKIWRILDKWLDLLSAQNLLKDEFIGFDLPDDVDVNLKFHDPRPIMSETEKLDNLAKRKDLGLNTKEELLMLDDPSLSLEDAKIKLAKLQEEKMMNLSAVVSNQMDINKPIMPNQNQQEMQLDQQSEDMMM